MDEQKDKEVKIEHMNRNECIIDSSLELQKLQVCFEYKVKKKLFSSVYRSQSFSMTSWITQNEMCLSEIQILFP